jgi:hypothetical protein
VGEEDIVGREHYTSTLKCYSTKGTLYKVTRDSLSSMQSFNLVWLELLEGIVVKEKSMIVSHISDFRKKRSHPS